MKLIKIQELLYQAFDFFNRELCLSSLPTPIITILSRGAKKRVLGWMWRDKWQDGNDIHHEIMIAAETLDQSFDEVIAIFIHEMAHLYNAHAKINDVNPAGRHNKKFKKTAEGIFKLAVEADKKLGWAYTALTDESRALVERFKKEAVITEWKLRRLDPIKQPVEKVYTVQVTEDHKEWLKDMAEEKDIKARVLLEEIIDAYRQKVYAESKNQ